MGLFSRYTRKSNNIFSKHGGKLTRKQFEQRLKRVPLQSWQREYVKRVMEKFNTHYSKGITREEFHAGLDEMAKNPHDRIDSKHIDLIKKHF